MQPRPIEHPGVDRARILSAASSIGLLGHKAPGGASLLAALCNPRAQSGQVAALIRKEPALYARVLRVANSPFYSHSREVTTIEHALMMMGIDAVRGIAAAACLDRTMPRGKELAIIDIRALLRHSVATAVAAETLAKAVRPTLAPEAFVAGLLHNLGVPVQIGMDAPAVQAMVALRQSRDERTMPALEAQCGVASHQDCIGVIAEAWQLPATLAAATHFHHDPMSAPEAHRDLASLVNLGANLGLAMGCTFSLEPLAEPPDRAAMARLGLSDRDLVTVAVDLPERVVELTDVLLT